MRVLLLFALVLQFVSGQPATDPLNAIRAKITVDSLSNPTEVQIAGQYANPSKELVKRVGGALEGENLYLFPDKSYLYCKWSDVLPNTVFDKGTWSLADDVLDLKSDPEIAWDSTLERKLLVLRRSSHKEEILLVGMERSLPYFEKHAGDDPELMLLIVALQRETAVSAASTASLKTRLMREAWRPSFFRHQ
jgi:hypothetical protein